MYSAWLLAVLPLFCSVTAQTENRNFHLRIGSIEVGVNKSVIGSIEVTIFNQSIRQSVIALSLSVRVTGRANNNQT